MGCSKRSDSLIRSLNCVHRRWILEVFLSPCSDFHDRIIFVFNAEEDHRHLIYLVISSLWEIKRNSGSEVEGFCSHDYNHWQE